jgi:putative endonuclease
VTRSPVSELRRSAYRRGRWAEDAALAYMQDRGLKLLQRNYRTRFGEIDLIMTDADILVLVEVRYRARNDFATAIESIDRAKCERILRSGEHYLQQRHKADIQCRLDAVIITGSEGSHDIEWLKHVYEI